MSDHDGLDGSINRVVSGLTLAHCFLPLAAASFTLASSASLGTLEGADGLAQVQSLPLGDNGKPSIDRRVPSPGFRDSDSL